MIQIKLSNEELATLHRIYINDGELKWLRNKLFMVYSYAELKGRAEDGETIYSNRTNKAIEFWKYQIEVYCNETYPELFNANRIILEAQAKTNTNNE